MTSKSGTLETVWISVAKAAAYTDLTPKSIRHHIAAGHITAVYAGRVLRVDKSSIDAWLKPVRSAGDL